MNVTPNQIRAAIETLRAVADAIKELKSVPSGHLYATLCGSLSLDQYNQVIGALKRAGLVREENHLLEWIESKKN